MINIPQFIGPFKDVLPLFIKYKRALGYDYGRTALEDLKRLDNFFSIKGIKT